VPLCIFFGRLQGQGEGDILFRGAVTAVPVPHDFSVTGFLLMRAISRDPEPTWTAHCRRQSPKWLNAQLSTTAIYTDAVMHPLASYA